MDELQHKELTDEEVSLYFTMEEFSLLCSVLVLVNIGLTICARIYVNIDIFRTYLRYNFKMPMLIIFFNFLIFFYLMDSFSVKNLCL